MVKKKQPWILPKLRASGYKVTEPRQAVIATIENHAGIFSVQTLRKKLRRLDPVSIYRTVELLEALDIVHPVIHLDGVQYYELHGNTHHHHIVCTRCQTSACIDCDIPVLTIRGFDRVHHTFIATGLCHACARALKK